MGLATQGDSFEHAGLRVLIRHDPDCEAPGWDRVRITYPAGGRYLLGNEPVDAERDQEIGQQITSAGTLIGLPVYAYIHSGVALTAAEGDPGYPFTDRWDAGRTGWVYMTIEDACEYNGVPYMTPEVRRATLDALPAIVQEFGEWVDGECYGYEIVDSDGEVLDSCWGYVGVDSVMSAAKRAAEGCTQRTN